MKNLHKWLDLLAIIVFAISGITILVIAFSIGKCS